MNYLKNSAPVQDKDQPQPSYSIEFAHIYIDEVFNGNHHESITVLKELESNTDVRFSKVVLIDDYNAESNEFSVDHFLNSINQKGANTDFYVFESDLVPLADVLLASIEKPKIARMYNSYIERKGKYPCSLLTATWYLVRLGRIDGGDILHIYNTDLNRENIVADRLINILPTSFKEVEKDVHKLISHSKFKDDRFKIQPILFQDKHPTRNGILPDLVKPTSIEN